MSTGYLKAKWDSWYADTGSNMGNGSGARLMSGKSTFGGVDWTNRIGIRLSDNVFVGDEGVSQVKLRLMVKGSGGCTANGSGPMLYVERVASVTDYVDENSVTGDCAVTTGGTAVIMRYPGPTTTTTHRASWSGTPATGDIIEIDITSLYMDWWAVRSFYPAVPFDDPRTCLSLVIKAQNEATGSQRISFHSAQSGGGAIYEGGNGPDAVVTFSRNHAPSIPTTGLGPSGLISGAALPTYDFDFTDADGDQCDMCSINVHTSNAVDGAGKMNAGTTLWDSGFVTPTTASGGRATKLHAGTTPTRGVQYYWQVNVKDATGDASGWSSPLAFKVNSLPVGTKVRPA